MIFIALYEKGEPSPRKVMEFKTKRDFMRYARNMIPDGNKVISVRHGVQEICSAINGNAYEVVKEPVYKRMLKEQAENYL